ncbi:MAG: hypothetical protein K0S76_703 [Herbinix sp.]|nr:hypothetical protein [Herbinix sp.]
MGYAVLNFYILLPTISFIIALIISLKNGFMYYLYPIFVGALGGIIPFFVFHNIQGINIIFAFVPASIGALIGTLDNHKMKKGLFAEK